MDSAKKTTHPAASARSPRPERGSFTPSSPAASSAEASTVRETVSYTHLDVYKRQALNHPEMSFPWNNTITWLLYGLYILVTVMLLIAPKTKK